MPKGFITTKEVIMKTLYKMTSVYKKYSLCHKLALHTMEICGVMLVVIGISSSEFTPLLLGVFYTLAPSLYVYLDSTKQ